MKAAKKTAGEWLTGVSLPLTVTQADTDGDSHVQPAIHAQFQILRMWFRRTKELTRLDGKDGQLFHGALALPALTDLPKGLRVGM